MRFEEKWLALEDQQFAEKIFEWFQKMKGFRYKESTRREHVQEAVDLTWGWILETSNCPSPVGDPKLNAISGQYFRMFNEQAPNVTELAKQKLKERERLTQIETILNEKIALVQYWLDTMWGPGNSQNEEDAGFLQGDEEEVHTILLILLNDAKEIVNGSKPLPALGNGAKLRGNFSMDAGVQANFSNVAQWDPNRKCGIIKSNFSSEAGIKEKGKVTLEWEGIVRGDLNQKFLLGSQINAYGQASVKAGSNPEVAMEVKGDVKLGVLIELEAAMNLDDILEAEFTGEAFAGAMAAGKIETNLSLHDGIEISAGGNVFAGASLKGEGNATIKWKGRPILKQTAKGSVNAGAGGMAEFELAVSPTTPIKLSCAAGATLGVGADTQTITSISLTNLSLAGSEWIIEKTRVLLRKEKYENYLNTKVKSNEVYANSVKREIETLLQIVRQKKESIYMGYGQKPKQKKGFTRLQD